MLKILNSEQMRRADAATLKRSEITSHFLMEQASLAFVSIFIDLMPAKDRSILILCGTGNNGGDGLAIARLLQYSGYSDIEVAIVQTSKPGTEDFGIHLRRLGRTPVKVTYIAEAGDLDLSQPVVIDALLGSGI